MGLLVLKFFFNIYIVGSLVRTVESFEIFGQFMTFATWQNTSIPALMETKIQKHWLHSLKSKIGFEGIFCN
jgi:hypothetical protein